MIGRLTRVQRSLALGLTLYSGLGCTAKAELLALGDQLPSEIDWLVAALVSENETEATALAPREGGAFRGELEGELSSGILWLQGYTEAEIRRLSDADASVLRSATLHAARSEEPLLPAAAFTLRGPWPDPSAEFERPSPGERPPPLTASWLPRCPQLVSDMTRVRVMGVDPCGATATQVGCRLEIDLGICGVGVSGQLVGGGRSVLEGAGEYVSCQSTAEAPARFDCELRGGKTDVIELVEAAPPGFEAELYPVSEVRFEPQGSEGYPFRAGTVHGPAFVGDRLVLSRTERAPTDCETQSFSSELAFVDPTDGTVTHTATAPPCLIFLESEADRDTFLGASGQKGELSITRFDREGRSLAQVVLMSTRLSEGWIDAMKILGDRVAVVVRFPFDPRPEPAAELIVLERASLREVFRDIDLPRAPYHPFQTSEAVGLIGGSVIHFFDRENGDRIDQWSTSRSLEGCLPGLIVGADWDRSAQRVIATEQRDVHRVILANRDSCRTIAFHEWLAAPLQLLATEDPKVWLVSLNGNDRISPGIHTNSGIAELDLETLRYRPGVLRFGYGPLGNLVADADGVIWTSLPWTGELARIRRRP